MELDLTKAKELAIQLEQYSAPRGAVVVDVRDPTKLLLAMLVLEVQSLSTKLVKDKTDE